MSVIKQTLLHVRPRKTSDSTEKVFTHVLFVFHWSPNAHSVNAYWCNNVIVWLLRPCARSEAQTIPQLTFMAYVSRGIISGCYSGRVPGIRQNHNYLAARRLEITRKLQQSMELKLQKSKIKHNTYLENKGDQFAENSEEHNHILSLSLFFPYLWIT